ncbi:NAD(+) synthase [Acetivibrio clariflavus]|uniref:Glutamine-dependent NAD(+) synthetase n=1 Tax=Acetivibrio clariflavus (strain DSM 19732 / NBRC 101661 / EBR45) TaxID=720554 RepID=G8LZM7_ACECE|nr:NAD(+) synthase [Acetivibrio clariflavus]AEV67928.1 NAD+ synthetase [Acetivibrio clariflavus DSM 19732]
MEYGFVRVGAAVPKMKVANCEYNCSRIVDLIKRADKEKVKFLVFPELCITSYSCGDLFHQDILLKEALRQLENVLKDTKDTDLIAILGMPVSLNNQLFNCSVVIQSGKILGVVPKTFIPNYSEFYEERWFSSGNKALVDTINICGQSVPFGIDLLFEDSQNSDLCFGIEICEDLWVPIPPSSYQCMNGATLIFNPSASNEIIGKYEYRKELVRQQSARCICGYVYTSSNVNESTTDVVFGGHAMVAEYGSLLCESERFLDDDQLIYSEIDLQKLINDRRKNTSFMEGVVDKKYRRIFFNQKESECMELTRYVPAYPFVPSNSANRDLRCKEIFSIQTSALAKRIKHTGLKYSVIGISGGLDSTLALLVTAKTYELLGISPENIIAVTMPGFGTTDTTYTNAMDLMKAMKVSIREINIKDACLQHFKDIGHDVNIHDVTYENVQARERTQILMDLANKLGGLVIGTGDLSELALGWCTYNGDHMSMYSVNCSIPKTLVKHLVRWVAENMVDKNVRDILFRILDTPISPELLPPSAEGEIKQKTEDIVGPYELHDFFMYHMIRYGAPPKKISFLAQKAFEGKYSKDEINKWLKVFIKRFFSQQFKRSCLPDGPKVGTISLSPRGDWRMPSDADSKEWLEEVE